MNQKRKSKIYSFFLLPHRTLPLYFLTGLFLLIFGFSFFLYQNHRAKLASGVDFTQMKKAEIEKELQAMVNGYPIEQMIPAIMEQDPKTIAFLVGIAKKESNWGKRVPVYQGQDCFNYWGYRGPNPIGSGGHSCFATPEEAVAVVAKRISYLVEEQNLDTPAKFVVWKCGSSCAGHSSASVKKWISDVGIYFQKLID